MNTLWIRESAERLDENPVDKPIQLSARLHHSTETHTSAFAKQMIPITLCDNLKFRKSYEHVIIGFTVVLVRTTIIKVLLKPTEIMIYFIFI